MHVSSTRMLHRPASFLASHAICVAKGCVCGPQRAGNRRRRLHGSAETLLVKQAIAMTSAGAVLGPLCDAQHSRYGVLHYAHPFSWQLPGLQYTFESCWWVPVLFGLAGLVLGLSHPYLDDLFSEKNAPAWGMAPPSSVVAVGIACFVVQYWASGFFESKLSPGQHGAVLAGTAIINWLVFDRSKQGLAMASLTAVCGPAVEIALINVGQLYSYAHPLVWGVPGWIPFVYFCGSPAVGNLGRAVRAELEQQTRSSE